MRSLRLVNGLVRLILHTHRLDSLLRDLVDRATVC